MSTPLLSPRRFANLQTSLIYHATSEHGATSCSMINGEIFRAFGIDPWAREFDEGKLSPKSTNPEAAREQVKAAIKAAVFDWQRANYNAHVVRYETEPNMPGDVPEDRPPAPSPRLPNGKLLNAPALCKALRALRYNCDGTASGEAAKQSLALLDRVIDVLKDHCLELLPEYRDAEWAI